MIKVSGIHKSYGDLQVLKGIDCHIAEGEIVSIVGPSGAGKSTLLQIMGTLDVPDKTNMGKWLGEININNHNPLRFSARKMAAFRNATIGFVFQFHHLLPEFTALENICIPAYIAKTSKKTAQQKAEKLLDTMGLQNRASHFPAELSGGEQQRVAVARALVNNPAVVLADEPSGNLDTTSANALHKLFFDLRDAFKQTFVIVTHNTELAQQTDRTLTLKDGIVVL